MARSLEQLSDDLKPTLDSRDDEKVAAIFDELMEYAETDAEEVEATMGWGILVACESGLECAVMYGSWFMDQFPDSVLPVKMEFAEFLAGSGRADEATELAREYLRLIRDRGYLQSIEDFTYARIGASKAFLILTAAYTEVGARSYSRRVLEYAAKFPLDPQISGQYQLELVRLNDELQDQMNHQLNEKWEAFFQVGTKADELYELCKKRDCHVLARRVDLIETNFRFKEDFRMDESEILHLVYEVETSQDSQPAQMLA